MIDFTNSAIEQISVHAVGNKVNGESLQLSQQPIQEIDERFNEMLLRYAVNACKTEEFYSFSFSTGEIGLNPLFNFAQRIFQDTKNFHAGSVDIATHLFNQSLHPQIKAGDFLVILFSNIMLDGYPTSAIGLFKSENKFPFLKIAHNSNDAIIEVDEGIYMDKVDKACLIFDIHASEGFQISVVDKTSKGGETRFWKDDFLHVLPRSDHYHATKIVMDMTKKFVTQSLGEQQDISRADQVELLNRSMHYFKSNEQYDKEGFEQRVLRNDDRIQAFQQFEAAYRDELQIGTIDRFDISSAAVKQQQRNYKSVIKLDKNFHIYIHGNRELIEQGIDHQTGKRYYKIYFDEES